MKNVKEEIEIHFDCSEPYPMRPSLAEKLLTPGPVPVPDFVQQAMVRPVIHHHFPEFSEFYSSLQQQMQYLFQTRSLTFTAPGSGTYGVEMAMYSLFAPGTRVVVVENGKFSERWVAYGKFRGMDVRAVTVPWGEAAAPGLIAEACQAHQAKGLVLTHCETSTGALTDLEEVALAARELVPEICIVADTITGVGALPYYHDDWGIDVAVTSSQKALMSPAGLLLFALSERAIQRMAGAHPADFAHLGNHIRAAQNAKSPFTPPVSLMFAVDAALASIQTETLPVVWNRVHATSRYFKSEIIRLGGQLAAGPASDSLTAFSFPHLDSDTLRRRLRTEYGLILSGGQDAWKGKILRIAHMGMAAEMSWAREVGESLRFEV